MAFAENTLLQKMMVSGLEIVKTKQLVKLRKDVHATDRSSLLCNHQSEDDEYDGALPNPPPNIIISILIKVIIGL